MTLDECEDIARRVAHSLPMSDFGSTRAIQAFAQTLRAAVLAERERCCILIYGHASSENVAARTVRAIRKEGPPHQSKKDQN